MRGLPTPSNSEDTTLRSHVPVTHGPIAGYHCVLRYCAYTLFLRLIRFMFHWNNMLNSSYGRSAIETGVTGANAYLF